MEFDSEMPTLRQQKAVEKLVETGGNVTQAMIGAGYSPASANSPSVLTESKGFQELVKEFIPDDLLLKVHREGLEANKVVSARAKTKHGDPINADEDTDDFIEVPDHPTRSKFLELGYKVSGKLSGEAASITNIIVPIVVTRGTDQEDTTPPEAV